MLHAQADAQLVSLVRAAIIDFESGETCDLSRIIAIGARWKPAQVRESFIEPLVTRGDCSLADVIATLAKGTGSKEVHVFARWFPDEILSAALRRDGIALIAHPLESIHAAALVSGQSFARLTAPVRAA